MVGKRLILNILYSNAKENRFQSFVCFLFGKILNKYSDHWVFLNDSNIYMIISSEFLQIDDDKTRAFRCINYT